VLTVTGQSRELHPLAFWTRQRSLVIKSRYGLGVFEFWFE